LGHVGLSLIIKPLDKPKEKDIDLIIRNPESIPFEKREWIKLWIEKDPDLNRIAVWYREFYSHLNQVRQSKENHSNIPAVVELNDYKNHKKPFQGFVLAAQTAAVMDRPLKSIKTFFSEEHNTLLRILYNHKTRQTRIHVISSYLADDDIVLLETENGKILAGSPGNVIDLPESVLSRKTILEWKKCLIHIPLCRINIYRDLHTGAITFSIGRSMDEFRHKEIQLDIHQERIFLSLPSPENSLKPGKAILHSGGKNIFTTISENSCEIPIDHISTTSSQVFLYN